MSYQQPPPGYPQQPQYPHQPRPPKRGLTTKTIVLGIVAFVVAALLVIAVVAVAASGDDESGQAGSPTTPGRSQDTSDGDGSTARCDRIASTLVEKAEYPKKSTPSVAIVLTDAYAIQPQALAAAMAKIEPSVSSDGVLGQQQDKSVYVKYFNNVWAYPNLDATKAYVSRYSSTGEFLGHTVGEVPVRFDQQEDQVAGYFRIQTTNGVTIPAEAGGTQTDQQSAIGVLPDAFDEQTVWVLLRGGTSLYKGTVLRFDGDVPADLDACTPIS
ncbi:hypothetical protein ACIQYZ_13500 [Rhodococcus erythropolis]